MLETENLVYSFESGRRGKPDELDDIIAMAIAEYILEINPKSKFDLRISGRWDPDSNLPIVQIGGEVSTEGNLNDHFSDIQKLVIEIYNKINRTDYETFNVNGGFNSQSLKLKENGFAGDSGSAIAVAYSGESTLPLERRLSVGLRDLFDQIFQNDGIVPGEISSLSGIESLSGLSSDGKIQVDVEYTGAEAISIKEIIIALAHKDEVERDYGSFEDAVTRITQAYVRANTPQSVEQNYHFVFNGRGPWPEKLSGYRVDVGNREAKPHRHGFGEYGTSIDSITGEDPSKPDMTATLYARYIAVQIVGNNLAEFARVKLSYSIGSDEFSINIYTNGTGKISQAELEEWVKKEIGLSFNGAISKLGLKDPKVYRKIKENSDFFQDSTYKWNQFEVKYKK